MDLFPLAHHVMLDTSVLRVLQLAGHPELCAADLAGVGLSALAQLDAHRFEARSPAAKTSGSWRSIPAKRLFLLEGDYTIAIYTLYICIFIIITFVIIIKYIYIYTSLYIIKAYTT